MQLEHYVNIGIYLRESRESLNLTIDQVAVALNIRPQYLIDIENGDLSKLPSKVYVRGYIKNYANYLGLDKTKVLAAYESLFNESAQKFFVPENSRKENNPKRHIVFFCVLSLIALFWINNNSKYQYVEDKIPELKEEYKLPEQLESCLTNYEIICFLELRSSQAVINYRHAVGLDESEFQY
ncbi:MAG: helix-turn-helix domain-containing protein [Pseudomonadota bacterium]